MYFVMTGQQCNIYTQNLIFYTREQNFHWICPCNENFFPTKCTSVIFRQTILKDHDIGVRCYYFSTTPLSHFVKSSL